MTLAQMDLTPEVTNDTLDGDAQSWLMHYTSMDAMLRLNMETIDSFVDSAPLSGPGLEFVLNRLDAGKRRIHSRAGQYFAELEYAVRAGDRWQELIVAYDAEEEPEEFEVEPYELNGAKLIDELGEGLSSWMPAELRGPEDRALAEASLAEMRDLEREVRRYIHDAQKRGIHRDYGRLLRLYKFNDRTRQYNGIKESWSPTPIQRAMSFCAVQANNRRPLNSQAHNAKMMETLNLDNAKVTRQLQRPLRGGTPQEGDSNAAS